jgi:flagellar protein FliS
MNAGSSYREAAIRGASPVRLVVCLYEQAITDLRRATMALEKGDIEARTQSINHALLVISHLQGTLDMDRGGEVARNLQKFYNIVRNGLMEAQVKQSSRILEQQISQLVLVHGAWQEVEHATSMPEPAHMKSGHSTPIINSPSPAEIPFGDWNA